jgi:type I restriction enzyme S subunit
VDLSGLNFISEERYNIIGGGKIKKGDILFCLRGSLGKCGVINNLERGVIASSLVIVRPQSKLYTKYLLYYFNSSLINEYINQYNNGAAQPNLSAKSLSLFYIPLPPLAEQKRIVQKLDALFERIDKAIALLQKNIYAANNFMNSVLNDVFSYLEQNHPSKSVRVLRFFNV